MRCPMTREQFLAKLIAKCYDFESVQDRIEFTSYNEPCTLICPHHGSFQVMPRSVLKSQAMGTPGCPGCAKERRYENIALAKMAAYNKHILKQRVEEAERRKRIIAARRPANYTRSAKCRDNELKT